MGQKLAGAEPFVADARTVKRKPFRGMKQSLCHSHSLCSVPSHIDVAAKPPPGWLQMAGLQHLLCCAHNTQTGRQTDRQKENKITHARTHARRKTDRQASTQARRHAGRPAPTHTCTHVHMHTCTRTHTHTCTRTDTDTHTHAHTHTHTHPPRALSKAPGIPARRRASKVPYNPCIFPLPGTSPRLDPKLRESSSSAKSRAVTSTLRSTSIHMVFAFSSSSRGASRTRAQAYVGFCTEGYWTWKPTLLREREHKVLRLCSFCSMF